MSALLQLLKEPNVQHYFSVLPVYLLIKDDHGIYVACTDKMAKLHGAKSSEIIGKSAQDFLAPAQAEAIMAQDMRVMHTEKSMINHVQEIQLNGKKVTRKATRIPLKDEREGVVGVVFYLTLEIE